MRCRVRLLGSVLLISTAAVGLAADPVAAHTTIASVTPNAGAVVGGAVDELNLTFFVDVTDPIITVTDPNGAKVSGNAVLTTPTVLRYEIDALSIVGVYVVEWSVVTQDGHRQSSAYSFRYDPGALAVADGENAGGSPRNVVTIGAVSGLAVIALLVTVVVRRRTRRDRGIMPPP